MSVRKRKPTDSILASMEHTVTEAVESVQELFHFDDMPIWSQDNPFILTGYRISKGYKETFKSLSYFHNETMNIYTHLLSAILFLGIIANIWINWTEPTIDKIMFTLYCICAFKCFLFSSVYHLHCHTDSKTRFVFFSCLDYAGISIMILGSCILMTYYIYYCHKTMQIIWLTMLSLLSLVGILGPFFESFAKHPSLRTICYILSGSLSGLPVGIHILTHSIPFHDNGVYFFLLMILCYVGGSAIYVFQIPERFSPGNFDIFFHSHQIWHCFVTAAAVLFYWCALDMLSWRNENKCV